MLEKYKWVANLSEWFCHDIYIYITTFQVGVRLVHRVPRSQPETWEHHTALSPRAESAAFEGSARAACAGKSCSPPGEKCSLLDARLTLQAGFHVCLPT